MITGITHFSFTVSNLDEALHFFCDLLGLKATPVRQGGSPRIDKIMKLSGVTLKASFVATPDDNSIELIEYITPKSKKIDLTTCNPGVAHVAFVVDDIQKMYEDLSAKGVEFNSEPSRSDGGPLEGWGMVYMKGPDGITIELMEPPEGVELDPATGFRLDWISSHGEGK